MPKAKENKTAVMSSELGDGDFAISRNPRTGRPMRKCHKADSPFVDSAVAISDEDSSDDESVMALATRTKKRKRTPSPPLSDDDGFSEASLEDAIESDEDAIAVRPSKSRELYTPTPAFAQGSQIVLKDVVVNVPAGHVGPVVLHLTPDMGKPPPPPPSPRVIVNDPPKRSKRPPQPSNSTQRSGAGFLDLPAELRNEIYSLVFVADSRFDLARPTNFARSAAFLRTCRQVHQEACGILYGENEFFFARRTDRHGSFWEDDWKELGFKSVRKFVKTIGPSNTSLIRHLSFQFEDATPCLNPMTMTHDERRFVHDDTLMSILRHLGDYAQLQTLKLSFHGRRRVDANDERFIAYLKRLKADEVAIVKFPIGKADPYCWGSDSKQAESVRKVLVKGMVRKQKLYD